MLLLHKTHFSFSNYRRLNAIFSHMTSSMNTNHVKAPTAGIIIIGDEILKGHVQDSNSHFLTRRLFSLGVKVQKISVIADDLDTIANEVAEFSSRFTHVITSGGIGPTHDDMTFEGVARAFDEHLLPHPELVRVCKQFFGTDDLASPKLKLAHVPASSNLHYGINKKTGQRRKYPLVNVKNVFVFPGVPTLMENAFNDLEHLFRNAENAFHVRELYINRDELSIADTLNQVNAKFKDKVSLGSYPDLHNSYYRVKLTVESPSQADTDEACAFIQDSLPVGSVVEYDKEPIRHAADRVYSIAEGHHGSTSQGHEGSSSQDHEGSKLQGHVHQAISVIEECFDKYELNEICVGFNGGKDCTALLHLVHAVAQRKLSDQGVKLKALYIRRGQPFPEIELFIKKSQERYGFDVITIEGRIKDALGELKQQHPEIKAVVMGTRCTDPYSSNLKSFSPTDPDWPQYMRVNPILAWHYGHVWTFLRSLNVPYCKLYDRGYTSLGSMENTHPNPELQQVDSRGIVTYRPAYLLTDGRSERSGRN